ncbi:MAG: ABC transporter ATP-binding protein [Neptuniibacter sp.]
MVTLNISLTEKFYENTDQPVLGDIDCRVPSGQFIALVGPSGTGKTTLLNMVAGLESSELGSILINRKPVIGQSDCKISYIFQQPRLMPWLTVAENLKLVAPDSSAEDREQMLCRVGLEDKSDVYPRKLSGGMQRRVSIARAFLTQPDLLLLDEPFVSLDQPTAENLKVLLEELWQEHKPTVLFVTHDLNEAIRLADRVLFLSKAPGSLLLDQSVDLLRPRCESIRSFLFWKKQLLENNPGLLEGEPPQAKPYVSEDCA